jgi:TRAP transporter TAXI family solute receptor
MRAGLVFGLVFVLLAPAWGHAKSRLFRIGTGGRTGVYYPVGKLIAQGLTEALRQGSPVYIGVAQNSAGSIENVRTVIAGKTEAGLVQADVAAWAHKGEHVFAGEGNKAAVRVLASLYPEKMQIVVRKDAGVSSFHDLRGKRVSIDEIGSGTLAVMRIVLKAHGMSEKNLRPVYLKPVFTHDKVVRGALQGFVMMAGHPMEAVTQLTDTGITIVPIAREVALEIGREHPYLVPGEIPGGVYAGVPVTPTVQVHALLVVSAALDEALAYQVTAALWSAHTQTLLHGGHPQGRAIAPRTALQGVSIPLHPGAERYYRENGMLTGASAQ